MQLNPLTFLFEIVNFLVLLFVLNRLVFRPLKRGIEERRAEQAQTIADAKTKLEQARALEQTLQGERRAVVDIRDRALREAAEEAAGERARILAQAREDAAAEGARAARLLESEREAAEAWVREVTIERATSVAGKMLLVLAPEAVEQALRSVCWKRSREASWATGGDARKAKRSAPLRADAERRGRRDARALAAAPAARRS